MNKDSKIFVAGHRGLVGSAILKNLKAKGYTNFVLRTHAELDLTDQQALPQRSRNMCSWQQPMSEGLWQTAATGLTLFTRIL